MHQVTRPAAQTPSFLADYLQHVGMENRYAWHDVPCEVCGGDEHTIIREQCDIGLQKFGKLPVVACNRCGFLFQSPRFCREFYNDYYGRRYRDVMYGNSAPSQDYIDDQIRRAHHIRQNLKAHLPRTGRILDVGCAVGAMLIPFIENGWQAHGTDPDVGFAQYGRDALGLPVEVVAAEEMRLDDEAYDLIIIMGSLEHVYDPNRTLELCRRASRPNGLLLLEGRGHPNGPRYFNHTHHRYLSLNSMELLMIRHGWSPVLTTDEPLSGPTRPGRIYCLGRAGNIPGRKAFLELIDSGKREDPADLLCKFARFDQPVTTS